jgi:hypothetical protein
VDNFWLALVLLLGAPILGDEKLASPDRPSQGARRDAGHNISPKLFVAPTTNSA